MKVSKLRKAHFHAMVLCGVGEAREVPGRLFRNLRNAGLVAGSRHGEYAVLPKMKELFKRALAVGWSAARAHPVQEEPCHDA